MISFGHDEIVKYPFLAEAGQYLKDQGFTLEQFATDPDLQIIVDRAYERIESASQGNIYNYKVDDSSNKDASLPLEVFSFLIAIIPVSYTHMTLQTNREV